MRIATWNVNSLKARLPRVEAWLAEVQPDVLCLQETKLADAAFPALAFAALGYESVHRGQGQWNGVAILSRVGIDAVVDQFADGGEPDPEARLLTATCGGIQVTSVYVPNGRALDADHYRYKLAWFARLRAHLDAVASPEADVVVTGDFNIAPADLDVWPGFDLTTNTHVSAPERAAYGEVLAWGLVDVFRQQWPQAGLYSYWDYRAGDFHEGRGMRIDLLLASAPLAARLAFVTVDRNARKGKLPSDHAPVVADFAPAGASAAPAAAAVEQ